MAESYAYIAVVLALLNPLTDSDYRDSMDYRSSLRRDSYERKAF